MSIEMRLDLVAELDHSGHDNVCDKSHSRFQAEDGVPIVVLLFVRLVAPARSWVQVCFRVVLRPLVLILHQETNGCPECYPMLDPTLNVNKIFLVSLFSATATMGRDDSQ